MIPEVLENRDVGDLLRGASIILAVEPDVQILSALERSRDAEGKTQDHLEEAVRLIAKVTKELALNGEEYVGRENARRALHHMLSDPPWGPGSEKYSLP